MVGEVNVSLPSSPVLQHITRREADSGIELDNVNLSPTPPHHVPEKGTRDDSATIGLSKPEKRVHRRSLSSDFFQDRKPKPVVTCVHRRNPAGRYCGHRRALSTDFQIDKIISCTEAEKQHKNPLKAVFFRHKKTPSNVSQISQGRWIC